MWRCGESLHERIRRAELIVREQQSSLLHIDQTLPRLASAAVARLEGNRLQSELFAQVRPSEFEEVGSDPRGVLLRAIHVLPQALPGMRPPSPAQLRSA